MTDPERHIEIRIRHAAIAGELLLVDSRALHDLIRFGAHPGDALGWVNIGGEMLGWFVEARPVLLEPDLIEDVGCSRCQETTPRCRCREVYGAEGS